MRLYSLSLYLCISFLTQACIGPLTQGKNVFQRSIEKGISEDYCIQLSTELGKQDLNIAVVPENYLGHLIREVLFDCSIDIWVLRVRQYNSSSHLKNDGLQQQLYPVMDVQSSLPSARPSLGHGIFDIDSAVQALLDEHMYKHESYQGETKVTGVGIVAPLGISKTLFNALRMLCSSESTCYGQSKYESYIKEQVYEYTDLMITQLSTSIHAYISTSKWRSEQLLITTKLIEGLENSMYETWSRRGGIFKHSIDQRFHSNFMSHSSLETKCMDIMLHGMHSSFFNEIVLLKMACPLLMSKTGTSTWNFSLPSVHTNGENDSSDFMSSAHYLRIFRALIEKNTLPVRGRGRYRVLNVLRAELILFAENLASLGKKFEFRPEPGKISIHHVSAFQESVRTIDVISEVLNDISDPDLEELLIRLKDEGLGVRHATLLSGTGSKNLRY